MDRSLRKIVLLELKCSFESNADKANLTKQKKYWDIKTDLERAGFKVDLVPLEIGARGHVNKRNKITLEHTFKQNQFKINKKKLFNVLSKISLSYSFIIFQAQGQPTWQDPPILTPWWHHDDLSYNQTALRPSEAILFGIWICLSLFVQPALYNLNIHLHHGLGFNLNYLKIQIIFKNTTHHHPLIYLRVFTL